ncbi:MAG: hypothetical protein RIC55_05425 [Pirellulaceae bacterium]
MSSTLLLCLALLAAPADDAATPQETSRLVARRAETLKQSVASFRLTLRYHGEQGKPFYGVTLSVPAVAATGDNPFDRVTRIDQAQALRLIDALAEQGFLEDASPLAEGDAPPAKFVSGYGLLVATDDLVLHDELGWDLAMLAKIDALRKVLRGEPAKDMDLLLARLSGLRAAWEAAAKVNP